MRPATSAADVTLTQSPSDVMTAPRLIESGRRCFSPSRCSTATVKELAIVQAQTLSQRHLREGRVGTNAPGEAAGVHGPEARLRSL